MNTPTKTFNEILAEMETERKGAMTKANEQRHAFLQRFCNLHITKVLITFSGSGDSGNIDDIDIFYAKGFAPDEDQLKDAEEQIRYDLDQWANLFLQGTNVDWYNNEGGQGEIEFDMETVPFKFRANVDVNTMSSETEFEVEEAL